MTAPLFPASAETARRPGAADRRIAYRLGLPAGLRTDAAELYWDAFGAKLAPAIGPRRRGTAVLARALVPERAIVTLAAGELVGLVGFHLGGSSFAEIRLRHLVAEFGWTGVPHWALLALLARRPREGELLLDGIVVRPDSRGQGIGTALLREVEALARGHGLEAVRLDVVDTNPDARRLYEREGFVATTTHRSPFLGRLFGFSASTTMVKAVGRGPDEMGRGDREPSAAEDGRCGARVDRRADTDCRSNVGAHPRDFDLERME